MTTKAPRQKITYLLRVKGLKTLIETDRGVARAIDGLDLSLRSGEALGIVGEAGVGKTALAQSLLRLLDAPGAIVTGAIDFEDEDLIDFRPEEMRKTRGKRIAYVDSDPSAALHPHLTVAEQIADVLRAHTDRSASEIARRCEELLSLVGIDEPRTIMPRYASDLGPTAAQRIAIAMAIACEPALIIMDEPTRALPATGQAQILDLIRQLREATGVALIFLTSDLGMAAEIADNVLVLYGGKVVEYAPASTLYSAPRLPYTQMLLASTPLLGIVQDELEVLDGAVPDPTDLPHGCRFAPRCPYRMTRCDDEEPPLIKLEGNRLVRCWLY